MRLLVFAAATLLGGSLYAADPELVSLAMPDTQVMMGVNGEQVMLSPFGQFLLAQSAQVPDELQKLIETSGFDPRRDLREILVASNGQPGFHSQIVLARGTFDIPKILEAAQASGAAVGTYKGVSMFGDKQGSIAFPDSTLAIAGDADNVRAAIDRKSAPTAISSALAVQVNQLSTTEDAWFVTMAPLSQLQPQAAGTAGAVPGPFAMYSKVQQASGGVKFGANVVVNLQAVSQRDQDAAALAAVLKAMGIGLSGNSNAQAAWAAELLQNLSVTAEGNVTKVSLTVPETLIEQMMQASHTQAAHPSGGADASVRAPAATVEQPAPQPTPQRIRVGGDVQQYKLRQHVQPVYPPLAMQARISGTVRLNAIIGKDGTVQDLTVVSGHPLLITAAIDAVKQWVYEPTLLNGRAVEVIAPIEVEFTVAQ